MNHSSPPAKSFESVVRSRRMTRSFSDRPIDPALLDRMVELAARAPSAGKTQGWHVVALTGADTARFWDVSLPAEHRADFRWPGLLRAPLLLLPLADPAAYVARYAEPDKVRTGLGKSEHVWPTPYWTVDASMSVMTLLLAAEDVGLGALFFGVFHNEFEVRQALGIPDELQLLGAIALGWPDTPRAVGGEGRSASRPRRTPTDIIHHTTW
ncbi:MAG: nitroreductase family protein [Ilumatobacteraceae bacterium]